MFGRDPQFSGAVLRFTSLKIEAIYPARQAVSCFNWMPCCPRCCTPLCLSITNTVGVGLFTVTIFVYIGVTSEKLLFGDSIRAALWTSLTAIWTAVTVFVIFGSIFVRKRCVRVTAAIFTLILGLMAVNLAILFIFEPYAPHMMAADKWGMLDAKDRRALEEVFRCCGWDSNLQDPDCFAALRYYDSCRWSVQYFLVSVYVAFLSIWFILGPWMILWSSIMLCVVVPEKEEGLELESQSGFHLTQPHDAPAFNANVYGAKTW